MRVKVSNPHVRDDGDRLQAVRAAIGDGVPLTEDADAFTYTETRRRASIFGLSNGLEMPLERVRGEAGRGVAR